MIHEYIKSLYVICHYGDLFDGIKLSNQKLMSIPTKMSA
jgi:hypothetical protein